jgi:5'/3'-nucleotidase SurE
MSWILLTNDDGIDATSLQILVDRLYERGHKLVVFAPSENNSAVSMKISLGIPLTVVNRNDPRENVHQYAIGGTPCDCIIAALDGGLKKLLPEIIPKLVVSGINLGPNMSQDAYHSGTMAAAREAGMYGVPAIASSWSSFDPEGMDISVDATVGLVEAALAVLPDTPANLNHPHIDINEPHLTNWPKNSDRLWSDEPISALRNAFAAGEMFLNLNVPPAANAFRKALIGSSLHNRSEFFGQLVR